MITPRYLVKNKTFIVIDESNGITEFRPVYKRRLQVYKGIKNRLEFKVLNQDQKPVDIEGYTPVFQAFNERGKMLVQKLGNLVQADDSSLIKGLFEVNLEDVDTINIEPQFLRYSIHLEDNETGEAKITYSGSHFENRGFIDLSDGAFPEPIPTKEINTFVRVQGLEFQNVFWDSEVVFAEPGINNENGLHTVVIYPNKYEGKIKIQATLENQIEGSEEWADVKEIFLTGLEKEPIPVNFNGVFTYIRIRAMRDPEDGKIEKVLVRN